MRQAEAPVELTGLHHLRLPVADLARAQEFWEGILGYAREFDFPGESGPVAVALRHPAGGPNIVLWHDTERARNSAGFVCFGLGLPTARAVHDLCERLDLRGVAHGAIEGAFVDVKLQRVETPDGQFVNFYVKPDPRVVAPADGA